MAASSSSEKAMEKQPPAVEAAAAAPAQVINRNRNRNSHVALPPALIEYTRNRERLVNMGRRTYDEEKVRRVWEIQQEMDVNDLMHHVMYGGGEEVVWDDEVWNLQQITQIPAQPPQAHPQGRPRTN